MNNQDIKISIKTVWILVFGNIILGVVGAFAKIMQWGDDHIILMASLVLFFSTFIIILSDMVRNKIENQGFWVFGMIVLPGIVPVVYLVQRGRLIKG